MWCPEPKLYEFKIVSKINLKGGIVFSVQLAVTTACPPHAPSDGFGDERERCVSTHLDHCDDKSRHDAADEHACQHHELPHWLRAPHEPPRDGLDEQQRASDAPTEVKASGRGTRRAGTALSHCRPPPGCSGSRRRPCRTSRRLLNSMDVTLVDRSSSCWSGSSQPL